MNFLKIFTLFVISLFFGMSCKKTNNPTASTKLTDVYVAGISSGAGGYHRATYWKNGMATYLTDITSFADALAITVHANDVYVAGVALVNGDSTAVYWKNGVMVKLTDNTTSSLATAISVIGSDVYVAGFMKNFNGYPIATYWKNGQVNKVVDYFVGSEARAIFINGNDVYLAGPINLPSPENFQGAAYWKNGSFTQLTANTSAGDATAIYINGTDIYVAGAEKISGGNFVATNWKNGNPLKLPVPANVIFSEISAFAFSTNNIYEAGNIQIGGNIYNSVAEGVLWKNDALFNIAGATPGSVTTGIVIDNTDVYTVGYSSPFSGQYPVATYWKNGAAVLLDQTGLYPSYAFGISVVSN